ncbi:hypothetical protein [Miniimonas sp. S16]|uniref:hypothetical protein n=1 Tax=Miniimonas sp. S16 TaxID=2171623 RepID=UPI000D525DAB|nr:hypothetical protein [Miniimonas sp. S16]
MSLPYETFPHLTDDDLAEVERIQGRVLAMGQLVRAGRSERYGRSRVESGRWQQLYRGTYVTHAGPVSFETRCWAALLAVGPGSTLAGETAAYLQRLQTVPPAEIEVVVPRSRRARGRLPGVRVRSTRARVRAVDVPPRTPIAVTTLDLVGRASSTDEVVSTVTAAVRRQGGQLALRNELERRHRTRHRDLLTDLLSPAAEGIESALEHRFDRDVLRAHGLPRMTRQQRQVVQGVLIRADVVSEEFAVRFELDGRLHRDKTDADVWRDNAVVLERGERTLRYRWRHIAGTPCRTARQVERALQKGGWAGRLRACGEACST